MILDEILRICKELAVEAGQKIMDIYNNEELFQQISYKADNSPLTLADKLSNRHITEKLKKEYPDYAILSEEEQDNKERLLNDYCFIIDPLDGTKEFVKRNGQFTVNIGLACEHRVVLGVIYVPVTQELYYAAKGQGAWMQKKDGSVERLQVTDVIDKESLRLVVSRSHGCEQMDALVEKYRFKNLIEVGSSLKGCMVARGDAEIYYRYNPTMEWDTAAMQCIAEEAGAIVKQMDDSELLYNRENSLNEKGFYIINHIENRI